MWGITRRDVAAAAIGGCIGTALIVGGHYGWHALKEKDADNSKHQDQAATK